MPIAFDVELRSLNVFRSVSAAERRRRLPSSGTAVRGTDYVRLREADLRLRP